MKKQCGTEKNTRRCKRLKDEDTRTTVISSVSNLRSFAFPREKRIPIKYIPHKALCFKFLDKLDG